MPISLLPRQRQSLRARACALLILLLMCSVLLHPHPANAAVLWSAPEPVDQGFESGLSHLTRITVDSNGWPHIVRAVPTEVSSSNATITKAAMSYVYKDETGWHEEVFSAPTSVSYNSPLPFGAPTLVVDKGGGLHVLVIEGDSFVYYHRAAAGQWQSKAIPGRTEMWGHFAVSQIAVDSQGRPHIVYEDMANAELQGGGWVGNKIVKYARREGNTWITEVIYGYPLTYQPSIAIDTKDRPHISFYYELTPSPGRWGSTIEGILMYAHRDESGWHYRSVDMGETNLVAGLDSVIALDNADRPHIIYLAEQYAYPDDRTVARYAYRDAAGKWHTELVDQSTYSNVKGEPIGNCRLEAQTLSIGPDGTTRSAVWVQETASQWSFKYIERINGVWARHAFDLTLGSPVLALGPAGDAHVARTVVIERTQSSSGLYSSVVQTLYAKRVDPELPFVPSPPSGLAVTLEGGSTARVSWADNSSNETGFVLQRFKQGVPYGGTIAELPPNTTSYLDTSLNPGQYSYRVKAVVRLGTGIVLTSANSNTATLTVPISLMPSAPTSLTATVTPENDVRLAWTDNADNEKGFRIERKTGDAGTWSEIGLLGVNSRSFLDPAPGVGSHTYRVSAYSTILSNNWYSPYSNEATVSVRIDLSPAAPADLWATALGSDSIRLDWRDMSDNENGFSIERSTGIFWVPLTNVGRDVDHCVDAGLTAGNTYSYRVRAYNQVLSMTFYSDYTNTVSAQPASSRAPAAPSRLRAAFAGSGIAISWVDNSGNESGFRVERKLGGGDWTQITELAANTTSYVDASPPMSRSYAYRVRSYISGPMLSYLSPYSNEWIVAASLSIGPAAPSGLRATAVSAMEIRLQWDNASARIDGYKIERSSAGGAWVEIVRVGGGTTTYHDLRLAPETQYRYRIRAYETLVGRVYDSAYSTEASVKTPAALTATAPGAPTAVALGPDRIRLDWQDQSSNETGFLVHRRNAGTDYVLVADLPPNTQSFLDTGLEPATTYTYMVGAYHVTQEGKTYSPYDGQVSATTTAPSSLAAPTNLAATPVGENDVRLTWNHALPAGLRFNIERQAGGSAWSLVGTTPLGATSHNDLTALAGTAYSYRVRAVSAFAYSGYSGTATAVTPGDPPGDPGGQLQFDGTQSGWAEPELMQAHDSGLTYPGVTTDFQRRITREEFSTIAVKLYEKLSGNTAVAGENPFVDTSNPDILKAYALGIVKGVSPTQFAPSNNITRQEMCVMIYRALQAAGENVTLSSTGTFPFTDASQIATWAIKEVRFCYENGIMKGTSPTTISPLVDTPREQAIVLIFRTYEAFK